MADLLDEIQDKRSENIASSVRALGGDLLDEVGLKNKNPQLLAERFVGQSVDDRRQELIEEMNADLSGFEQFLVGAGRGLTTVARGAGIEGALPAIMQAVQQHAVSLAPRAEPGVGASLAEPEPKLAREGLTQLVDESTPALVGEVLGEAVPFLLSPQAAGPRISQRIGEGILVGALEGNIISRGREGDTIEGTNIGGLIGGGVEAVTAGVSRLGSALLRSLGRKAEGPLLTPAGTPTPEFQQALDDTGTNFADLVTQVREGGAAPASRVDVAADLLADTDLPGVDPAQAARAARFKAQDIPATTGDISQEFVQQAGEQRLISQAADEAGEPLRQVKLAQSEAFTTRVDELVNGLGVPANVGESLKQALTGRKKLLKKEKNALYKQVAETAPEVANFPVLTDSILEAVPGAPELRRLSRLAGSQVGATQELLVEFGIDSSDEAVKAFTGAGGEITPLSLGNFEDFRQALNLFDRADQTGAASVVIGPVKRALDEEVELVDTHLKAAGFTDEGVLDTLKQARERTRTIKTEFSPESITGRLIDVKRDGVTPVIEASKVSDTLLRPTAPVENLQRTLDSLRKAGEPGQRAIRDLQASVVLNALEQALKAPSRKTGGVQTIGGNQFAQALTKFGDDKLDLLFAGNKKALNRLRNLKQTALDISPDAAAVPKGSAPVILDLVRRAGSLPGFAAIRDTAEFIVNAGADDRAVRKAVAAKPVFKRTVSALERDFPTIAAALGIAVAVPLDEDE